MNTKWKIGSRRLLFATMVGTLITGCSKEELQQAPVVEEVEGLGAPKVEPFFLSSATGTGTYNVYKWNSGCQDYWGTVSPNPRAHANNSNIIAGPPSFLKVDQGSCIPDGSWLRLQRGNTSGTVGSWGPWYYIWPLFGPSVTVRKGIKIRIKMVSPLLGDEYNKGMSYDGSTNTWNIASALASGNFEITEQTGIPTDICPPK